MNDITRISNMKEAIVWLLANRRDETSLSEAIGVLRFSLSDASEACQILNEIAVSPAAHGLQGI